MLVAGADEPEKTGTCRTFW